MSLFKKSLFYMETLKIGFDAKRIFNNTTGLGVYGRSLVKNLVKEFPNNEYYLFTPKETDLFRVNSKQVKTITAPGFFNLFWRSYGINKEIATHHLDIYHGLSNEIPFKLNHSTKYICTIHDLIWLKYPDTYKKIDRNIYTKKLKHACTHSDMLIATSKQTANDLHEIMDIPKDRIRVVYQSGNEIPHNISRTSPIDEPYFFYLSSFQKRKNHLRLVQAYSNIKDKTNRLLVLAGKEGETFNEVKRFISDNKLQSDVVILSNLNEIEKYQWLKHADAFVYPSIDEGFGIPLIEAMQLGTPLLLNDIPVFKEIAEDTAEYFSLSEAGDLENKLSTFKKPTSETTSNLPLLLNKFSISETSKSLLSIYLEIL